MENREVIKESKDLIVGELYLANMRFIDEDYYRSCGPSFGSFYEPCGDPFYDTDDIYDYLAQERILGDYSYNLIDNNNYIDFHFKLRFLGYKIDSDGDGDGDGDSDGDDKIYLSFNEIDKRLGDFEYMMGQTYSLLFKAVNMSKKTKKFINRYNYLYNIYNIENEEFSLLGRRLCEPKGSNEIMMAKYYNLYLSSENNSLRRQALKQSLERGYINKKINSICLDSDTSDVLARQFI
jgi:hypothetical protein